MGTWIETQDLNPSLKNRSVVPYIEGTWIETTSRTATATRRASSPTRELVCYLYRLSSFKVTVL